MGGIFLKCRFLESKFFFGVNFFIFVTLVVFLMNPPTHVMRVSSTAVGVRSSVFVQVLERQIKALSQALAGATCGRMVGGFRDERSN